MHLHSVSCYSAEETADIVVALIRKTITEQRWGGLDLVPEKACSGTPMVRALDVMNLRLDMLERRGIGVHSIEHFLRIMPDFPWGSEAKNLLLSLGFMAELGRRTPLK